MENKYAVTDPSSGECLITPAERAAPLSCDCPSPERQPVPSLKNLIVLRGKEEGKEKLAPFRREGNEAQSDLLKVTQEISADLEINPENPSLVPQQRNSETPHAGYQSKQKPR